MCVCIDVIVTGILIIYMDVFMSMLACYSILILHLCLVYFPYALLYQPLLHMSIQLSCMSQVSGIIVFYTVLFFHFYFVVLIIFMELHEVIDEFIKSVCFPCLVGFCHIFLEISTGATFGCVMCIFILVILRPVLVILILEHFPKW